MAEGNGSNGASGNSGFTVKEILLEMRGDLRTLSEQINRIDRQGSIGTKQELEDHENRIRSNEANIRSINAAQNGRSKLTDQLFTRIVALAALIVAIISITPHL